MKLPLQKRRGVLLAPHVDASSSGSRKSRSIRYEGNTQIHGHGNCKFFTESPGKMFAVKRNSQVLISKDGGHTWEESGCSERLLIRSFAAKKLTRTQFGTVYRLEGKGTFKVNLDGTVLKKTGKRSWEPASPQNTTLFNGIHLLKS